MPDLLVLAKALGGGLPLGAFVGRPDADGDARPRPAAGARHHLRRPPACRAPRAWRRWTCCCAIGSPSARRALGRAIPRASSAALVGRGGLVEVRGIGLLLGLEFADAGSLRRASRGARWERGLILNWTLHRDTVVRLAPPLTLTDDETASAVARITEALGD